MDIRDLKRPPVLDDPETYDAVLADAERTLAETALLGHPRNVALLAALQCAEMMVGMANAEHQRAMVALAMSGARPHSFPVYQSAVEAQLSSLRPILRAIDVATHPDAVRPTVALPELRDASHALLAGAHLRTVLSLLDEALLGWRGFRVNGREIELLHRSPAHLRRRIEGALHAEAAHNARLSDEKIPPEEERFYARVVKLQDGANTWDWMRNDDLIAGALLPARRAAVQLHGWDLEDVPVGAQGAFTVSDFRRVVEVVHAIATLGDLIGDPLTSLGTTRVLRGPRDEWIRVLTTHSGVPRPRVDAALEFLVRRPLDEPRGHLEGRSATTNPFFDIGGDELALSVVCTMWQDPVWSLLATWKRRAPADFGAKTSARGHRLAQQIHDLFAARGWTTVLERKIPNSDLDVATSAPPDRFVVVVEAKAFADDPVRQSEDPTVWTQLADNVNAMRDEALFHRTFAQERLEPGEVVGLLVVPEYMTPAGDLGSSFGAAGVRDLATLVAGAASPRDLWLRIKATETVATYPLKTERFAFRDWVLVFDIGDRSALPVAVRATRLSSAE